MALHPTGRPQPGGSVMGSLSELWERLRASLWFVPSLLTAGAVALAWITLALDRGRFGIGPQESGWLYSGTAEGASTLLGAIAGSTITIAGVVFSLTLVAMTLASQQFGPRLLRHYMRDATTQVVMGAFLATFLFSLLVLRGLRREGAGEFVPHLSVSVAMLLAVVSLGLLIHFIHHVAVSLSSDEVVARVAAQLDETVDRLFPEGAEGRRADPAPDPERSLPEDFHARSRTLAADRDGYVVRIDLDRLLAIGIRENVVFLAERRPGDFVAAGTPLVSVRPGARMVGEVQGEIRGAFRQGNVRSPLQDVLFCVDQVVEVAVRALSPSQHDPFTAMTCLDRLGASLRRLAGRQLTPLHRRDGEGRLRVLVPSVTFPAVVGEAFAPIRRRARENAEVMVRLLQTLALVAEAASRPEDRAAVWRHAEAVAQDAQQVLRDDEDRRSVEEILRTASRALRDAGGAAAG